MRPATRYAPALPLPALTKTPKQVHSPLTFRPNASWVCQRCYHQSRQALYLKKAILRFGPQKLKRSNLKGLVPWAERGTLQQKRLASDSAKDVEETARQDLPSHEEGRRSELAKSASHLMDNLQSNIFIAGQRLNDLTGYSGIEALKKDIEQQERKVQNTRKMLQEARDAYAEAISQRSSSQREVNELLQRKHAWSPQDLERFTTLYRSDHANEQAETAARDSLAAVERDSEEAAGKLSASILARYHEEQIWSDKIRRMSTWGTWGLMGVNVLLFLLFQIGVEPWRRKRLVKGFEDKVMEALEREGVAKGVAVVDAKQVTDAPALEATEIVAIEKVPEDVVPEVAFTTEVPALGSPTAENEVNISVDETEHAAVPPDSPKSTLERIRDRIQDEFSEREMVLRRVDLTTATLEGAAAGVAFMGVLVLLLRA